MTTCIKPLEKFNSRQSCKRLLSFPWASDDLSLRFNLNFACRSKDFKLAKEPVVHVACGVMRAPSQTVYYCSISNKAETPCTTRLKQSHHCKWDSSNRKRIYFSLFVHVLFLFLVYHKHVLSSQRRVSIIRGVCLDNGPPGWRDGNESPLHRVRGRKKTRSRHSISGPEWFESPLLVTSKWSARNQTKNHWEQEKLCNNECSTSDHLQQCWGVTSWFALSVETNNAIWVPLPESGQILHSATVVISFFRGWV